MKRESHGAPNQSSNEGFVTVQFIMLVGFTLALLVTIVMYFMITYRTNSVRSIMREAARAGTQSVDLQKAITTNNTSDIDKAEADCRASGDDALHQLFDIPLSENATTCNAQLDTNSGEYVMRAQATLPDLLFVTHQKVHAIFIDRASDS
jgi:hypothetical protein